MSTLPEQFSAVRKAQLDAQINFFQNFTARSLESVQQLVALNLNTSRASMEKSSAAVAQLLTVKDPRDLFSLTNNTQESFDGMLAYSRAFMAIATGTGAALAEAAVKTVPELKALALVKPAEPASVEPAAAVVPVEELVAPVAQFVAPVAEPEPVVEAAVVARAVPAAPPEAEAKPIAKAVNKVAKSAAPQPAAAPVPAAKPVVVTGIKPVDAAAPPAPVSAKPTLAQQQLDLPAAKSKKKK